MVSNPLTSALQADRPLVGAFCGIPSVAAAEYVAAAGYDYVCVDMQHGLADLGMLPGMLAAISGQGSAPIVRVPANEPWIIMKVLDAGALGVIVPLVESAEEAARAVAACRYPPTGSRSFGPVRAAVAMGSREPDELADVACIVMVETADGLAKVDEVAATPGVDALYVGPVDLALGLGIPPGYERPEPEHGEAIRRVRDAAKAAGVGIGVHCQDGAGARRWLGEGFGMTTVGSDHGWLRAVAAAELAAARS